VPAKLSAPVEIRVIYCGDNREQFHKLPDGCVDLIYNDPPFNSNLRVGSVLIRNRIHARPVHP
jgi:DNA modification methylase